MVISNLENDAGVFNFVACLYWSHFINRSGRKILRFNILLNAESFCSFLFSVLRKARSQQAAEKSWEMRWHFNNKFISRNWLTALLLKSIDKTYYGSRFYLSETTSSLEIYQPRWYLLSTYSELLNLWSTSLVIIFT